MADLLYGCADYQIQAFYGLVAPFVLCNKILLSWMSNPFLQGAGDLSGVRSPAEGADLDE